MKLVLFSGALLVAGTAISATPVNGWYSSVFGGVNYLPDNISITRNGFSRTDASYEWGYNVGGRLGVQVNPIRYEGEVTYLNNDFKRFYVNELRQARVLGQTEAILGMANVYYDLPDMVPTISPFLGAGIGYGWIKTNLSSRNIYYPTYYAESSSVFAYQGTAGFTYNFAENYALTIAYRYIGTPRVDALGKVFQAHLASVGVIYRFNEYCYK